MPPTKVNSAPGLTALAARLLGAAQLFLLGLIIWLAVKTVIALLAPESLWEVPSPTAATSSVNTGPAPRLDMSFDPFHRNAAAMDEVIEIGTDAPETTLNLKLFGRRAGKDGSAILQTPDKQQKAYRIGEQIMDGVTLKAVNADYIVLSQGGRIERLTFERESEGLLGQSNGETSQVPKTITAAQTLDASSLMRLINLAPVSEGNRLTGFRISAKNGGVNLEQSGLRNGDIVSAIDNINLTAPSFNPASLAGRLSGKQSVTLQVKRGTELLNVKIGS